ncbi:MAG TPA: hypothetical protein PK671_00375 [Candidatus Obscuribacter sp.]|nr:hypothetical protein [Candidatus Obscuribacter sp.]
MRTEFLERWRAGRNRNPQARNTSQRQDDSFLTEALAIYSRYRPRPNLQAQIEAVEDQPYIVLPADINLGLTGDEPFRGLRSVAAQSQGQAYYPLFAGSVNNPMWFAPPFRAVRCDPQADPDWKRFGKKLIGQPPKERICWLLPVAPTEDKSYLLTYVGIHQVEDADLQAGTPAINTLDFEGEESVLRLMTGFYYRALHDQMVQFNVQAASGYARQSKSIIDDEVHRLAPLTSEYA